MLFFSELFLLLGVVAVTDARSLSHRAARGDGIEVRAAGDLKQVTRAEIVTRGTRSQDVQRRQVSVMPYPRCADYVSTGPVPYARWDNLDYDQINGAVFIPNVPTREQCIKYCELDRRCEVSTYNKNTLGCFKTTANGRYFIAPFDATIKGVTCESSTAVIAQYRQATCCTEYRAATP